MIKRKIIVMGATGKTGSVVVTELLKAGYPARAMVHREDGRSAQLKTRGAEIAVAEMSDVERIADALSDVQGAYLADQASVFDPRPKDAVRFAADLDESVGSEAGRVALIKSGETDAI